jgi:PiT family inorganic phosphate transporter
VDLTLAGFWGLLGQYPSLIITSLLTLAVILVNGWTDAPNAIATCVSTRAMRPKAAILMAAVFNFFGLLVMTMISPRVAETIYNMVDFGGSAHEALIGLCAAMVAIVLWASLASVFGIPTSESHALIAGLSGAAIAMHGSLAGINGAEWVKVLYGLLLSTVLGFVAGWAAAKLVTTICRGMDRRRTEPFFKKAEIFSAAAMAFFHGAQDGQKFMGVFLLGMSLAQGQAQMTEMNVPLWLMALCAIVMGLGTSIGGEKIIKEVGMHMVRLEKYQGFAADMVAAGCLLLSTLTGVPVSTTHTKTTAMMGVGAARNLKRVNWNVVKDMLWAWVLTFPGCGLVGYLTTKLFLRLF